MIIPFRDWKFETENSFRLIKCVIMVYQRRRHIAKVIILFMAQQQHPSQSIFMCFIFYKQKREDEAGE